jgi:predicted methyltransferase
MSIQLDAASIARVSLHDPTNFSIQHSQTLHRLVLLQHWNIHTGSRVLELGCGQGDCTTVLAYAVGEQGRVVAVDPAELDYGASSHSSTLLPVLTVRAERCGLMFL